MAATDAGNGLFWDSATTTTPSYSNFVKYLMTDMYLPRLNDARNNASALATYIPATSDRIQGKFVMEPVKYGRNYNAFNNVRRGGKFPDPGQTNAALYSYQTRTEFFRAIIEGEVMRQAKDQTALVDPVDEVMRDMMDDLIVDTNRKLNTSDGSGRLCEVSSGTSGATTLVVRNNQDIASIATCTTRPAWFLEAGMRILICSNAGVVGGGSGRGVYTIVSIDSHTDTANGTSSVTVTPALTANCVAGDWIVKVSNDDTSPAFNIRDCGYRTEPMGLAGIFLTTGVLDGNGLTAAPSGGFTYTGAEDFTGTSASSAGFQGIAASSSFPFNQANVLTNSGVLRDPTDALLQASADTIEKANNAKIDFLFSNYEERTKYGNSLLPEKRFMNTMELKGGFTALEWAGRPWVVDRMCYANRIYMMALETGGFAQHVSTPLSPATQGDSPTWIPLQDDDKFQYRMVQSYNNGVGVRNRCGGLVTDVANA